METRDPLIETSIKVEMSHPTVKQKIWKKFYRVDSYKKSIKKGLALDIGLKILASGSTSLLYESLVNKKKIFSAVGGYYQGLTKGEGNVYFYAIPNEEINLDEVDKIINDEMKIILNQGISEKRFEIEKKKYIFDSIYSRDGILNPAQSIGESLTIGFSLDDIENLNKKINEITIFDVKDALKSFQENKNFIIGGLKS